MIQVDPPPSFQVSPFQVSPPGSSGLGTVWVRHRCLPVCGIPAVDEAAGAELGAGDAGQHDAVGDQRRHRHGIAFLDVGGLLTPEFLAGLGVERDHIGVERGAEHLAVEQRGAAIDDAAADDARRLGGIFDLGLPDLLAGLGVDRHRGVVRGDVDDALVDQRLRFLAAVVGEAVVPHRNEVLRGVLVDLRQRAEPLQVVAHAVVENVRGVGRTLDQLIGGLGACTTGCEDHEARGQRNAFHQSLPLRAYLDAAKATVCRKAKRVNTERERGRYCVHARAAPAPFRMRLVRQGKCAGIFHATEPLWSTAHVRCHRQARLPASRSARKVIVAGANDNVPARAGTPAILGNSSLAPSASAWPLRRSV